jgi:glucose-6-phosphate 1-dehydrogenase
LGKETVQNLMAVRFGNMLFEPLWNAQYVDHIQITVAETVGVGGRGEYYDKSGAMRDMVQNHLMQLLCLIAMEPPAKFDPSAVRDEKLKVIRALDPVDPHHIVRGQYVTHDDSPSYRKAVNDPRSKTESFVAMKVGISNWRWAGIPFYLRTGKMLSDRASEITVVFKKRNHTIFEEDDGEHRNILSIRLQPNEGITLGVTIKEPGPGGMRLIDVPLDMTFAEALGEDGGDPPESARPLLKAGVYWPGAGISDLATARRDWTDGAPVVPIIFYRALVQGAGLNPINRVVKSLLRKGMNPLPVFVHR